jgi:adenine-specific DNA-methyltransferase
MSNKHTLQKLELTWIGKGEEPKLEPRILIENHEYSYGDNSSPFGGGREGIGNMLIHGDNLLALKALEQDFAGKVKCIYIDPPYNTGSAFDFYDDGLEHSLWLNLMKQRLVILRNLLSEDGSIFVSIDNNEMAYLQVLMDEIFQRSNRKNTIIIKRGSVTGAKVINPGLVNISEFILVYTKNASKWNPNRLSRKKDRDVRYGTYIENYSDHYSEWRFIPLLQAFALEIGISSNLLKRHFGEIYESKVDEFVYMNADRIIQMATLDDKSISKTALELKQQSQLKKGKTFLLEREAKRPYFIHNGKLILFVKDRLQEIDGELSFSEPLTDIWDDVLPNDLHNEGGVEFRKGKKPEKLIQRVFSLASNEGDLVLDSFLGSGSTAAVALKMNRRWIGIELGDHAISHCYPRLKSVVDGEQRGISKAVTWQGGGGFKFYELAPSLLNQDKFGNWVISTEYNAQMLAAAMAKQEGFTYQPDEHIYWKQGRSSEHDYIYVTTQFLTVETLESIHDEMQEGESLLISCKAFQKECKHRYQNITIKKIPQMLLGRCEFGKDDYSLNIVNMPTPSESENEQDVVDTKESVQEIRDRIKKEDEPTLF